MSHRGAARWAVALAAATLTGCLTLPGQEDRAISVPRIVDREYTVVWVTLLAALRNEGALVQTEDATRGVIETYSRLRPGTKIWPRGLLDREGTRNVPVQVRYAVQAHPLGSQKTEVRLLIAMMYLDRGSGTWIPGTDDGTLMASFWRRFENDLAYYGMRPETWRPDAPKGEPAVPDSGPAQSPPGEDPPRPTAR